MGAFHEVRLPARLAFGSTGGVERRTEITTLASGFERRSTPWALGRRRYLIGANLRSLDDMAELVAFFEARRGRLYGFRFKDFADFKSCAPGGTVSAEDQVLGVGDGVRTAFGLVKRYGDVERPVSKPVEGSARVAVGGVEVADFTVDETAQSVGPRAAGRRGRARAPWGWRRGRFLRRGRWMTRRLRMAMWRRVCSMRRRSSCGAWTGRGRI